MRTVLRYLNSAAPIAGPVLGAIAVRIIQPGHLDERAAQAIGVIGSLYANGGPGVLYYRLIGWSSEAGSKVL